MNKKKLSLKVINVHSFVTSLENGQQEEVKGGGDTRFCPSGQYSGCPCGTVTCRTVCDPTCMC